MALFLFCQTISYVVKTVTFETKILLKLRHRDFIKNSETCDLSFKT